MFGNLVSDRCPIMQFAVGANLRGLVLEVTAPLALTTKKITTTPIDKGSLLIPLHLFP